MNAKSLFILLLFNIFGLNQALIAQSIFDKWPELKSFHGVMSQTFHPAEKGDLKPIKMRSEEMKEKAAILAKSKAPEEFQTDQIKNAVTRLKVDSKKLHKIVKNKKSDAEITKAITDLHDVFHEIVGLCKDEQH